MFAYGQSRAKSKNGSDASASSMTTTKVHANSSYLIATKYGKQGNAAYSCLTEWRYSCSWKMHYFPANEHFIRIISYLCSQIETCRGNVSLTALAYMHPQYLMEYEATRFCLVCLNLENSKKWARRGTTVHVYTWACRLMVFSCGFSRAQT